MDLVLELFLSFILVYRVPVNPGLFASLITVWYKDLGIEDDMRSSNLDELGISNKKMQ